MELDSKTIQQVVEKVLVQLQRNGGGPPRPSQGGASSAKPPRGVFQSAEDACQAAQDAFEKLRQGGYEVRRKIVDIVKTLCAEKAKEWGKLELDETRIGRLDHKIEKLQIVKLVPGVEWIAPRGMSGDHGLTMEEFTPFGVVGAVTPSTHSIPTLAGNIINIVAAGNTLVANAHPGACRCAAEAIRVFNEAIERETGIANVACCVEEPTLESFQQLCAAPQVRLLCITGGPGVVAAALQSGKRAICAGPGNPPVVVDETANLDKAAADIIQGGAYDNNLLCIGEKAVFVVDGVYRDFLRALESHGAARLDERQLEVLTKAVFEFEPGQGARGCGHAKLRRDLVGKDVSVLAEAAGARVPSGAQLLYAETEAEHAFVVEEQMMPMVPVVRVRDFDEGLRAAVVAEHNYKHSGMIHSRNVDHMSALARALDTTLFVKNGPCVAGLGLGGEGYLSYSIATTTGEGITTPLTFTRSRRCCMVDNLRIF